MFLQKGGVKEKDAGRIFCYGSVLEDEIVTWLSYSNEYSRKGVKLKR